MATRTRKSKIFTNAELSIIKKRRAGNYKDDKGMFAKQVKPKLKELLELWVAMENKNQLLTILLIDQKKKNNTCSTFDSLNKMFSKKKPAAHDKIRQSMNANLYSTKK